MEIFLLFVSSPNVSRKRPFTAEMEEGANRILAVLLGPETANKSRTDPPELRPVRGTRDACRHSGRWCRLPRLCGWPLLWVVAYPRSEQGVEVRVYDSLYADDTLRHAELREHMCQRILPSLYKYTKHHGH